MWYGFSIRKMSHTYMQITHLFISVCKPSLIYISVDRFLSLLVEI